jgi:hypothetical protein
MPDPGKQSSRARQPSRRRSARPTQKAPQSNSRGSVLRERLRRDPFLFMLCLGALAFVTWAFALTWWVTGGVVPLALALASVAPAVFLFYLRDA